MSEWKIGERRKKALYSLTDLQALAELLRSLCLSAAIVLGGGWTLIKFSQLLEAERATAQLKLSELEADKRKAELRPMLQIEMSIDFLEDERGRIWLLATVKLENSGINGLSIDTSESPFRVAQVKEQSQSGRLEFGEIIFSDKEVLRSRSIAEREGGAIGTVQRITIQPSRTIEAPFLVQLPGPGLYFAEFRAGLSEDSIRDWEEEMGASEDLYKNWSASRFFSTIEKRGEPTDE